MAPQRGADSTFQAFDPPQAVQAIGAGQTSYGSAAGGPTPERVDTVVVGAGQAGLAVAYHLTRLGRETRVLEAADRVGDSWRKRWDSLRLFTPAEYDELPGMPFPATAGHFPDKEEVADYLEAYAYHFQLPVETGARVETLWRAGGRLAISVGGRRLEAANVVVATGAFQRPRVPAFAAQLDPAVPQLHSSEYRRPSDLPGSATLVVGVGNSGAQIALELAKSRGVYLAGRERGQVPRQLLGLDVYWWLSRTLLRTRADTFLGRRMREETRRGDPLVGITRADLSAAGVRRVPRVTGARDGRPLLADGTMPEVDGVLWATGYRPDFSWISLPILGPDGYPRHRRGVVPEEPGLYFLGLRFLHRLSSSLLHGVGEDAAYVARHIAARAAALQAA